MIYGDTLIRVLIDQGHIKYYDEKAINPASINLRLGNSFAVPMPGQIIQLGDEVRYDMVYINDDQTVQLEPGKFVLATTMEWVEIPIVTAAFVHGRSSIGRAGLSVQNAGFVDAGFHGHITLELKNDAPYPIILKPGYPVAQLVFLEARDVSRPYEGKYNGQVEATGSRMYMDGAKGTE